MKYARELIPQVDTTPTRLRNYHPEIKDEFFWDFYDRSKDFSMVHISGFYNVYQSMIYIKNNNINGCMIECGCFLGGIAAFMGLVRKHLGIKDVEIILFDTFEGPPIGAVEGDYTIDSKLPNYQDQVKENITEVVGSFKGYTLVAGSVEDTIPHFQQRPSSLLRLDTDFYTSTKAELESFYPHLSPGGVVIIDDYGCFQGSRDATDEYFARQERKPLLNRIDGGVWAGVKPETAPTIVAPYKRGFLDRIFGR